MTMTNMGSDTVDLVIEIEEAFGIVIPDDDASKIQTVADLHDYVLRRLPDKAEMDSCLTMAAFNKLRRGLLCVFGVPRGSVRPSVDMESLIPRENRRAKWRLLGREMALRLPELEHPRWLMWELGVASVFMSIVGLRAVEVSWPTTVIMTPVVGGVIWLLGLAATSPLALEFGENLRTIGEASRAVMALNFGTLSSGCKSWNRGEVWDALVQIIVQTLGVRREAIRPEARIVEDFGAD